MQRNTRKPRLANRQEAVADSQPISISVDATKRVSGLLRAVSNARVCYVLAHGAGAGMTHPFMADMADRLAEAGMSSLRYQFPYMEEGSHRVDSPALAQATVRAAVAEATRLAPGLAVFAGGKSFGGRMTSQAQADSPLPGVRGLIFLGFPLHPPGRPSAERAEHLYKIQIPMLFLQGSRDEFANLECLERVIERLGPQATLKLFADADHSFHAPKRSERTDSEIKGDMLKTIAEWIGRF